MDLVRRHQATSDELVPTMTDTDDTANKTPSRSKRKCDARKVGKSGAASMNSAFSKEERLKAVAGPNYPNGHGENGIFTDKTPKTCNNCNSPDHLAGDCTKPKRESKARAASNVADSNLSKKAKRDLQAALQASLANTQGAAPEASTSVLNMQQQANVSGKDPSGSQRGVTPVRLQQLMRRIQ